MQLQLDQANESIKRLQSHLKASEATLDSALQQGISARQNNHLIEKQGIYLSKELDEKIATEQRLQQELSDTQKCLQKAQAEISDLRALNDSVQKTNDYLCKNLMELEEAYHLILAGSINGHTDHS